MEAGPAAKDWVQTLMSSVMRRKLSNRSKETGVLKIMSACGVLCSDCPAYLGSAKGLAHQKRTAEAWRRIYGRPEAPREITCGGCLSPDDRVFYTCRACKARRCCRESGYSSCAECSVTTCPDLEKAQSVWDGVPEIGKTLSPRDFILYAEPYCNHRRRLEGARMEPALSPK